MSMTFGNINVLTTSEDKMKGDTMRDILYIYKKAGAKEDAS